MALAFIPSHSPTLCIICTALTLTASLVPGNKEPVSPGWPAAYSSLGIATAAQDRLTHGILSCHFPVSLSLTSGMWMTRHCSASCSNGGAVCRTLGFGSGWRGRRNCISLPCSQSELVSVSCCKCNTCFVNLGHNFSQVLWKSSSFVVNPHSLAINQSPLNAELSCCFSKHEGGCVYLQLAFP